MNRQKKEQSKRMKDNCVTTKTITTSNEIGSISTTFTPTLYNMLFPFRPGDLIPTQAKPVQEKNMYFSEDTQDYQARNRLYCRAADAIRAHEIHLRDVYHLNDTDTSKWSQEDAVQAIKDGKFTFRRPDEAKKPGTFIYCGLDIRYRDPEKPADEVGFKTAREKLSEAFETVVDHISVTDPKDALKKVDSFREHKFH